MFCKVIAIVALAALSGASSLALAGEHDVASYQIDTEIKLTSDQRTRGVSDSLMRPALKLSAQFAHESGFVAIAEIVNVSTKEFMNGDGLDITLGGGYRFGNPEGWHFGLGAATEIFPGAKLSAPHHFDFDTFDTDYRDTSYNSSFAVFEAGYGALEARALYVLSSTYRGADTGGVCGQLLSVAMTTGGDLARTLDCYARGDHDSRGSVLLDLDYKIPLAAGTTLNLHAGYQRVANFNEANFADYRLGITRKQWGFDWSADYMLTRSKVREVFLAQDGNDWRATDDDRFVISVSRRF